MQVRGLEVEIRDPSLSQFTRWDECGYITPTRTKGNHRKWPPVERAVARLMLLLTEYGLSIELAAEMARDAVVNADGQQWVHVFPLDYGIELRIRRDIVDACSEGIPPPD